MSVHDKPGRAKEWKEAAGELLPRAAVLQVRDISSCRYATPRGSSDLSVVGRVYAYGAPRRPREEDLFFLQGSADRAAPTHVDQAAVLPLDAERRQRLPLSDATNTCEHVHTAQHETEDADRPERGHQVGSGNTADQRSKSCGKSLNLYQSFCQVAAQHSTPERYLSMPLQVFFFSKFVPTLSRDRDERPSVVTGHRTR